MVSQPESGETLNITETLIRSGAIDVIVLTLLLHLFTQKLDGQMGDTTVIASANDEPSNERLTAAILKQIAFAYSPIK